MMTGLDINKLELAAERLKAMAHPIRIAIVELLSVQGEMSVTDIHTHLKIEQAAASHHLNLLKSKRILSSRRDGKKMFYKLGVDSLSDMIHCINKCSQL